MVGLPLAMNAHVQNFLHVFMVLLRPVNLVVINFWPCKILWMPAYFVLQLGKNKAQVHFLIHKSHSHSYNKECNHFSLTTNLQQNHYDPFGNGIIII
uniref:Uncharacterized protein n=1 Tax=Rhizophora mucronata TaxID=61149 RepID=A0A2P2N9K4_RHIMU